MIGLIIAIIFACASFFGIIFFTNPNSAGVLGVVVLVVSSIMGAVCIALLIWQLKILKKK
ncbi:hypothetical protein A3K33_02890 [Candidatus Azambacteria bacterium RIFOXYC1_FULL_41_20]|nr:MAG: hypothetical protein A3K28_02910 [Candidatus Azambacteria bacterium RIFOXYB1_FULL_40_33]OGD42815.1 MAG: hypothetical protein A2193_02905 [Candidatus Azambacteria bacterium RIFOXYA1_FULL_42_37]OGD43187.1 MAG: hypothetical protein A3I82_01160 [Candidatus Azambacteria bacterium RIFCSPLOWO2_02_FULL_42_10]OGD43928.1 MAG: hypothetical protein A3K33_02890 [Candidatus Azambacteria bacterium RIFOXYC1_FULL_41_20]OGD47721.1 MAG: hypothetical protein A3K35_02890 [Candidatus Azambacteria bacterium R